MHKRKSLLESLNSMPREFSAKCSYQSPSNVRVQGNLYNQLEKLLFSVHNRSFTKWNKKIWVAKLLPHQSENIPYLQMTNHLVRNPFKEKWEGAGFKWKVDVQVASGILQAKLVTCRDVHQRLAYFCLTVALMFLPEQKEYITCWKP